KAGCSFQFIGATMIESDVHLETGLEYVTQLHFHSPVSTLGAPASSSAVSTALALPGSTSAAVSERRATRYRRIRGSAASSANCAASATSRTAALRCNSGPSGRNNGSRESKISCVTVMEAPSLNQGGIHLHRYFS